MGEKFNGQNFHNNAVDVDFVRRTVHFKPLKDMGFFAHYFLYLTVLWIVFFIFSAYVLGVLSIVYIIFFPKIFVSWQFGLVGFFILLVIPSFVALFYSFMFFDPVWRVNVFPKANYHWHTLISSLCFGFDKEKLLTVNPDAVIDKRFFLPYFDNVGLDYEASGDFSRFLLRIRIINLFEIDTGDWFCVFEFSEQPVHGSLKLRYI